MKLILLFLILYIGVIKCIIPAPIKVIPTQSEMMMKPPNPCRAIYYIQFNESDNINSFNSNTIVNKSLGVTCLFPFVSLARISVQFDIVGLYDNLVLEVTDSSSSIQIPLPKFNCLAPPTTLTIKYYRIDDTIYGNKMLRVYFNEIFDVTQTTINCQTSDLSLDCSSLDPSRYFTIGWRGPESSSPLLPLQPFNVSLKYIWAPNTTYTVNISGIPPLFTDNRLTVFNDYSATVMPLGIDQGNVYMDNTLPMKLEQYLSVPSSNQPIPLVWTSNVCRAKRIAMTPTTWVYLNVDTLGSMKSSMYAQVSTQMMLLKNSKFNFNPTNTSRLFGNSSLTYYQTQSSISFFTVKVDTSTTYPLTIKGVSTITPPFPFGFTSVNGKISHQVSYIYTSFNTSTYLLSYLITPVNLDPSTSTTQINSLSPPQIDSTPPKILSVEFTPFNSTSFLVKINVVDLDSGVGAINMVSYTAQQSSLMYGNRFNGTYVFLYPDVDIQYTIGRIRVVDNNKNEKYYDYGDFLSNSNQIPIKQPCTSCQLSIDNIVSIQWYPSIVDTSNSPGSTSLIFTVDSNITTQLSLLITLPLEDPFFQPFYKLESYSYYDTTLKAHRADFQIPKSMDNYTINYIIKNQFSQYSILAYSSDILPKFGLKSQLSTISNYGDKYGPKINSIKSNPNYLVTLQPMQNLIIGFDMTIEDSYNGMLGGEIDIISDVDNVPRRFKLDSNSLTSGDSKLGVYSIRWSVKWTEPNQVYSIKSVYLYDSSGWASCYPQGLLLDTSKKTLLNSFMRLEDANQIIKVTTNVSIYNSESPQLQYFNTTNSTTIDVTSNNRNIVVLLGVNSFSGISTRPEHSPIVYLMDCDLNTLSFLPITAVDQQNDIYGFIYNIQIPYGFGNEQGISVSVHGIFNIYYNFISVSSQQLLESNQFGFISTTMTSKSPYLSSSSTLRRDNQPITIYGRYLAQVTSVFLSIDSLLSPQQVIQSNEIFLVINITNIPTSVQSVKVTLPTSSLLVIPVVDYIPVSIPPVNPSCPGTPQCGGSQKGICTGSVCQCLGQWYGPDCGSLTINVDTPNVTTTDPTVTIGGGNVPPSIYSIISIYSIRELGIDGSTIQEFKFKNWTFNNQSLANGDGSVNYLYNSLLDSSRSTMLNVTIQWFKTATNLTFAGDQIYLPASSTKITLSLSPYQFDNSLNSLQILMNVSLVDKNGNRCSSTSYGTGEDANNNDIGWVKIRTGDTSVYARFIQKGIVDSRVTTVSNSIVTLSESSSTRSFIGVNVPHFTTSVILDPDISMLLEQDNNSCNSKNGLTNAQLAGIIVASVIVAFVIVSLILLVIKRRYRLVRKGAVIQMVTVK